MTLKERLIGVAGDDYRIVRHCDAETQQGFFIAALFIPAVFVICWASSLITFCQIFDSTFAGFVLSLFFAWMITNLYRLLLYTFSRNPLPQVNKKLGKLFSRGLRLAFMCFIATMIAKPLESVLYAGVLDHDIAAYKIRAKQSSHYNTVFYYQRQIDELMNLTDDALDSRQLIQNRNLSRRQAIVQANALIDSSGFFLQRLRFLCVNHRSCWWITAFFVLVFLYPIALKYYLRNCSYYQLKGACDQRKVNLSYYVTCKRHAALFEKLYSRRVSANERYEDSPYNTIHKEDRRRFLTEKEFITELYHV